jgi:hypothetical protein
VVALIDTPGAADANAYADVAYADAYFANRLYAAVWTAASADDKARALIMATRHLDEQVEWDVTVCGEHTTTTQALEFPRNGTLTRDRYNYYDSTIIPPWLKDACAEQAMAELGSDRTADPSVRGISSVGVGPVAVQFDTMKGAPESQVQHVLTDEVWAKIRPWAANSPGAGALRSIDLVRV